MSYYPDGTGPNDPNAPWNQPDAEYVDCPDCEGLGQVTFINEEGQKDYDECATCNGGGEIEDDGSDDEPDEWEYG